MRKSDTHFPGHIRACIQNPYHRWSLIGSLLVHTGIYFIHFVKKDLILFPDNGNLEVIFYKDSIDNGHSRILDHEVSDTGIRIDFMLEEGFVKPYVGIDLLYKNQAPVDISSYNEMHLEMAGPGVRDIFVYLIIPDSAADLPVRIPGVFFGYNINADSVMKSYRLPLKDFRTPDWWYDVANSPSDVTYKPDWAHLKRINITTGLPHSLHTKQTMQIQSIRFVRNNVQTILILGLIEIFIILITLLYYPVRLKRRNRSVTITYKPLESTHRPSPEGNFLEYINANFQDNTITLETVSKECGISERKITHRILREYKCNFRTYVNRIRINEAKRLLKDTDMNISEIAYKVGFNSPNHFNRVFKALTGTTPSGFVRP